MFDDSPNSSTVAVIGGLTVGHVLFMLRYPDAWLLGFSGLVVVVSTYTVITKKRLLLKLRWNASKLMKSINQRK